MEGGKGIIMKLYFNLKNNKHKIPKCAYKTAQKRKNISFHFGLVETKKKKL